jgi:glutamate transport system permease protein
LLVGFLGTLQAAALTVVLAAPLGALLAVGRLSQVRVVRWLATAFIEIARTVPVLLLIYLMLFGLPHYGINLPVLWKLVIPLTVANSAVFAEIIRAGVLSLPRGQEEAALGLGMLRRQALTYVVFPQALRSVTPSLVSQLVSVLKDTALGYIVAFTELLYRGQVLSAFNHLLIQTFLVVTLIYFVFNASLSAVASRLRARPSRRGTRPPSVRDQVAAITEENHV